MKTMLLSAMLKVLMSFKTIIKKYMVFILLSISCIEAKSQTISLFDYGNFFYGYPNNACQFLEQKGFKRTYYDVSETLGMIVYTGYIKGRKSIEVAFTFSTFYNMKSVSTLYFGEGQEDWYNVYFETKKKYHIKETFQMSGNVTAPIEVYEIEGNFLVFSQLKMESGEVFRMIDLLDYSNYVTFKKNQK